MFQTLDTMLSLGIIYLILSMTQKYIMSLVKRWFKLKPRAIVQGLQKTIGKAGLAYLLRYMHSKNKHSNYVEKLTEPNKLKSAKLEMPSKEKFRSIVKEMNEIISGDGAAANLDDKNSNQGGTENQSEIKDIFGGLEKNMEDFYESAVKNISAAFKDKMRTWTFFCGLIFTILINADFFYIYNSLSKNTTARETIIAQSGIIQKKLDAINQAINTGRKRTTGNIKEIIADVNSGVERFQKNLDTTGLQMGWSEDKLIKIFQSENRDNLFTLLFSKIFGLLISALLISFGAPFWHDYLSTVTGMRKLASQVKPGGNPSPKNPGYG